MNAASDHASGSGQALRVERAGDRELVITRLVAGPRRLVFRAWADPELFRRWWAPASFGLSIVSFEADVRTGGSYRLGMTHPSTDQVMTFLGRYLEVTAPERIVWTNEEGDEEGAVTTVTFEDRGEATLVTVRDLYPTAEAMEEAIASGSTSGWDEQLAQLEAIVASG